MPEHIRALIVILLIALMIFAGAKAAVGPIMPRQDFERRRNLWILLTIVAFLAHNFWIYASVAVLLVATARQKEPNPTALYLLLLFIVPSGGIQIPGFGLINYFFTLSHQRLLALIILFPAFVTILRQPSHLRLGSILPDRFLIAYLLLISVLTLRDSATTESIRVAFYQFIDVFLPYFVISRSLRRAEDFRTAIAAFILAAMVLGAVGVFESAKHWLLYQGLTHLMDLYTVKTLYLERAGALRAVGSVGQPIVLGYVMAVALGLYLYLQAHIRQTIYRRLGLILIVIGLIAPFSRGPWVGAILLTIVFIWTGRHAGKRLVSTGFFIILTLSVISMVPNGQKVVDLLPFIGHIEEENITYREKLLENSLIVIKRNLLLGSTNYRDSPEMQSMRQGQGIIDIVNTYVRIALDSGLIGLSMFGGFFLAALTSIYRSMQRARLIGEDLHLLGRSLLATLSGILSIIFTVSSITVIPLVYWIIAGMGVAYAQLVRQQISDIQARNS